jgi:hypothetical protein
VASAPLRASINRIMQFLSSFRGDTLGHGLAKVESIIK